MRCVCCNEMIEYRPPNTVYENEEDRFICGSCLDVYSPSDEGNESYFVNIEELDSIVYNNGVTPARFID